MINLFMLAPRVGPRGRFVAAVSNVCGCCIRFGIAATQKRPCRTTFGSAKSALIRIEIEPNERPGIQDATQFRLQEWTKKNQKSYACSPTRMISVRSARVKLPGAA